eukprot:COSAG02_NODE_12663_length_1513_cov_0.950495_3_plen_94_part_00
MNHIDWEKDETITLAVKHASVESAGSFGLPQSFNSTSWDDSCHITVVLELDNMQSWDDENGNRKTLQEVVLNRQGKFEVSRRARLRDGRQHGR